MRILAASLVLGAALAAAVVVGTHRETHSSARCSNGGSYGSPTFPCSWTTRPAWALPGAIVIAFAGLGVSAAAMTRRKVGT